MKTITTLAIAVTMAALLSAGGPWLDDRSAERDQAADIEAAQHQAQAQARYDAAVRRLCGDNSAWMQLQDGAIQCTDKRGKATTRVVLTAQVRP